VGSDGALWFTLFPETTGENDKIGRITTAGVVTEYSPLTPNSRVAGITPGPDGAMWYSLWILDRSGGKIGRITADGAITEYPLPIPGSLPQSITTGSDGALWFLLRYRTLRLLSAPHSSAATDW
jgi:virginiamycin B lyase